MNKLGQNIIVAAAYEPGPKNIIKAKFTVMKIRLFHKAFWSTLLVSFGDSSILTF
jgi:hypothetical protein